VQHGDPAVRPPTYGLYHDFRNPPAWHRPWDRFYAETLEQIAWAEAELGFRTTWISEHHGVDDGYTPSPLALAAAIATRTQRMEIGTSIAILPLQHPVRLAEDALTVDALSGGRFRLGVGAGYREPEFALFGVPMAERFSGMEHGLAILRAAFDGQPLDGGARHPELTGHTVTPGPLVGGGPELWVGAFGPQGIDRAARFADGMVEPIPALWPTYIDACARHGTIPRVAVGYHWIPGDDPEAELHRCLPHILYQLNEYGFAGAFGPGFTELTTAADVLTRSPYVLADADLVVREIVAAVQTGYVEDVHWWTRFPGEPIEWANARLEWFARTVAPRVEAALVD
jgi:alkanesulfonate monooxygenase SsuD/methylene tetrahydromethanopterin reductase-like flavin-dependent oxidoreductase (luciferase family)